MAPLGRIGKTCGWPALTVPFSSNVPATRESD
jgi:hypothetical protein